MCICKTMAFWSEIKHILSYLILHEYIAHKKCSTCAVVLAYDLFNIYQKGI